MGQSRCEGLITDSSQLLEPVSLLKYFTRVVLIALWARFHHDSHLEEDCSELQSAWVYFSGLYSETLADCIWFWSLRS